VSKEVSMYVNKQRFLKWPKYERYYKDYKDHCNGASQTVKKLGEGMKVEKDELTWVHNVVWFIVCGWPRGHLPGFENLDF